MQGPERERNDGEEKTPETAPGRLSCRRLEADEVSEFVEDVLFDRDRSEPVVAVTTSRQTGQAWLDPDALARDLAGLAGVVFLETGDATWALTEALPPRLDVYNGAVRIWWPGFQEDSEPGDHPLHFVFSEKRAERVREKVLVAISPDWIPGGEAVARTALVEEEPAATEAPSGDILEGQVVGLREDRIDVIVDGKRGVIKCADMPISLLASNLYTNQTISLRPFKDATGFVTGSYSAQGLLHTAWQRIAEEHEVGDVVIGRVQNIKAKYIFVELLPGAVGFVHISEISSAFVQDPRDHVSRDDTVRVEILDLDPEGGRAELSIRRAVGREPKERIPLVPGGVLFPDWEIEGIPESPLPEERTEEKRGERPEAGPEAGPVAGPVERVVERTEERTQERTEESERLARTRRRLEKVRQEKALLEEQYAGLDEEHKCQIRELRKTNSELRKKNSDLHKEKRSLKDKLDYSNRQSADERDPASSAAAFKLAVRLAYARKIEGEDRFKYPLGRIRVGGKFLETLRSLEEVTADKVAEVCMEIATGLVHEIPGRSVHELHENVGGARTKIREKDGARAWRCSLQDKSSSARRLHWWSIPGKKGNMVEFANVAVHEETSIPE